MAIVRREPDGGEDYHPVLECAVHVDHIWDSNNDDPKLHRSSTCPAGKTPRCTSSSLENLSIAMGD